MSKKLVSFCLACAFVILIICGALFTSYTSFNSSNVELKLIASEPRQQLQKRLDFAYHEVDLVENSAEDLKIQTKSNGLQYEMQGTHNDSRYALVKEYFPLVMQRFSHPLLPDYKEPCFKAGKNVKCLPYFYLVSPPKCATTDFWFNLQRHPQIVTARGGDSKEPHFWGHCDKTSEKIVNKYLWRHSVVAKRASKTPRLKSRLITGDGSCSTLWSHHAITKRFGKSNLQQNVPFVWADVIHAVSPGVKLIVILRNPINRVISDYFAFTSKKHKQGPKHFHRSLVESLKKMNDCLYQQNKTSLMCVSSIPCHPRIHISMYIIYLREWMRVFPREQFLIFTTEEWINRTDPDVLPKVHQFLEIDPITEDKLPPIQTEFRKLITDRKASHKAKTVGEILPESRALMEEFFEPFNRQLAEFLGDDKYLWK